MPQAQPLDKRTDRSSEPTRPPSWIERTRATAQPAYDLQVCPPALRGQQVLFRLPRQLTDAHTRGISGRDLRDNPLVQTTAAAYAAERHYSPEWQRWVCRMLGLALAIRDADGDDLVREEALDDLPHFADAAAEVLRRTGLLRPRPAHRPAATAPSRPWSLTLSGWTGPPRRSQRRSRSNGRPRPGCGPCTGPRHWKTEPHGSPPGTPRNERSHLSSPHASSSADSALSCDAWRHSGTRFCSRVRRPDRRLGGSLRQFAVAAAAAGLMWANMLRPFQLGKARTSHKGPWSWIRESRVASSQDSCPACHFTNASASAVM